LSLKKWAAGGKKEQDKEALKQNNSHTRYTYNTKQVLRLSTFDFQSPTLMTDSELISKYQTGDTTSFETLLRRHQNALYTFLLRLTADRDRAEDLFQETFLHVLKALPKYKEQGIFRHWLFRIANNVARDAGRRDTARLKRVITDNEYVHTAASSTTRPDTAAVQSDLLAHVEAALSGLPDKQREVFLLRVHSGMRFREISEHLNEPLSTVISQMRYAVTKLKPILKPIIQDES
jgi:RNA polymerase sigma-70 factor (ECF subfamily)